MQLPLNTTVLIRLLAVFPDSLVDSFLNSGWVVELVNSVPEGGGLQSSDIRPMKSIDDVAGRPVGRL